MLLQIIPLAQSPRAVPSQALDLSPAPSTAEQSLLMHGLSSVYDPNHDQEVQQMAVTAVPDTRAVVSLTATPSQTLDNR